MKRFCREISYRYLVQRSCQETSSRDLCKERALIEILYRDLARAYGGDLVQRPGEESRGLARRSFIDSPTQGSCTAASTENLSRRSCARSSTEIFTLGTCRTELVSLLFTTRVALVLLACSH